MDQQLAAKIDSPTANSQLQEAPEVVTTSPSPKSTEKILSPRTPVEPPEENLTDEERALRIAEAKILFPKYMASLNSKRCNSGRSNRRRSPLLYLPSHEYGKWNRYCDCSPSALINPDQKSEIDEYFARDCRNSSQHLAKHGPNPIELDPRYYNQEWNHRLTLSNGRIVTWAPINAVDNSAEKWNS